MKHCTTLFSGMRRALKTLCLASLLAVLALMGMSPCAFAASVEGPLGADPSAYEQAEDEAEDALAAQSEGDGIASLQSTSEVDIVPLSITIDKMLQLQKDKGSSASLSDLDPNENNLSAFADLTAASGLTAAQLDAFIDSTYSGRSGMLHGMGAAFVRAEQECGVSAAYLLAHAVLESGWGTSTLAKGYAYDGSIAIEGTSYASGTYYNFFGIGAYDSSPLSGGRSMAVQNGWDSPEDAIVGGARWIAENYVYRSSYPQKTIYAMRWDYDRANATGSCWHQYATSLTWVDTLSELMDEVYAAAASAPSYRYIVPLYNGWSVPLSTDGAMYRLYNPNSGEHFYTAQVAELTNLVFVGWTYEGIGWTAPDVGESVYRLYNSYAGEHHYTTSAGERDALVSLGWTDEGVGWLSAADTATPVYRLYNPNAFANNHHYTTSAAERDWLVSLGWNDEGLAWYAL